MTQYQYDSYQYDKEFFTPIRVNMINKTGQPVGKIGEGVAKLCYECSGNCIQLHLNSFNHFDFPLLNQYNLTAAIH